MFTLEAGHVSLRSVIYFCASTVLREVLATYMSWGVRDPVSTIMFSFSAAALFLLVPLSDSFDPTFAGSRTVCVMASLSAAMKLYAFAWCKSSPQRCHAVYQDYTLTVSDATRANATFNAARHATGNVTAAPTEHVIFSMVDLMGSCDLIVLVLSLQVHNRSLMNLCVPQMTSLCHRCRPCG